MRLLNLKYSLIALTIYSFLTIQKVKAQVNIQDSLALVDLYSSTGGTNWTNHTNWLTAAPISSWYGITVYNGRVVSIAFNQTDKGNNLSGTILPSLGNLTDLVYLDFDNNSLTDTLPSTLGNLTNLLYLSVSKNNLSGPIPFFLKNLVKLTRLYLGGNNFSDSIPSWIGNLTHLGVLNMWGNKLTGIIPPSLGNLTNLTNLWLFYNKLSGSIPSSLGNITSLTNFQIGGNKLSGTIPSSLGKLINLTVLDLDDNQLSGPIPSSLGSLTNLRSLLIEHNQFTFSGLETIAQKYLNSGKFTYAPQATIPLFYYNNTLHVSVGGSPVNITYTWYKDGIQIVTKVGDSTFNPDSNGQYYVVATNAMATKLSLTSNVVSITALPINDYSLKALASDGKVLLQWHTSTELNTSHFIIQQSTDGSSFTDKGTVNAIGIGANNYSFTDATPTLGINYYRLKMVDKDGSFSYSKVVSVQLIIDNYQLSITPNPAKDKVNVKGNHIVSVKVIDNLGRVLRNISFRDACNPILTLTGIPAGIYHLRVQTTDGKVSGVGLVID